MPQLTTPSTALWGKLSEQTLGSPVASVTFSGLDTSYTFFRLTLQNSQETAGGGTSLRLNNDSGANYEYQKIAINATTRTGARVTGADHIQLFHNFPAAVAGEGGHGSVVISKPVTGEEAQVVGNSGIQQSGNVMISSLLGAQWNNTADLVDRVDLVPTAGNFETDSRFLLEGAKPV